MKYISVIVICLICKTSFSQFSWNIAPPSITRATKINDSSISKRIIIRYTTDKKGRVITTSYVSRESTSSDELLIKDARLKTMDIKPVIHTREGVRYVGTYTFIFTPDGRLLLFFQNRMDEMLIGSLFTSSTTPYS